MVLDEKVNKQLKGKQVIAVICNQWGDTGKGKFSDYFAACWADVIARGTGGNNAGHTVVINDKKRIFHLIPSGILYDKEGKINILGNGMVLDLKVLVDELNELDEENISYRNLMISEDAHVIMPYHILKDIRKNASQKNGGIGSTGRGIGPCYSDKIARTGIMIRDLYNKEILFEKIKKNVDRYPEENINPEEIYKSIKPYSEKIKPFVKDTITEIHKLRESGRNILLEGAQGLLLSVDFGSYPYVTSSDPSINGTAAGVGLPASVVDLTYGIVKFPYMTRVGGGPFLSEFGVEMSEKYCAAGLDHDIKYELDKYEIPCKIDGNKIKYDHSHKNVFKLMNSEDIFKQGVGMRLAGEEYGATTGRPRRCGWTDLVALKYAVRLNGPDVILTKVDVLRGSETIKLVTGYKLPNGEVIKDFTRDLQILKKAKPIYEEFKGFSEDISIIKDYNDLPKGLKECINFTEEYSGAKVRIVSTGPDQQQTIIKE